MTMNTRIFIGASLGVLTGYLLRQWGVESIVAKQVLYICSLLSGIFVSSLKMVVMPLIFTSIVVGVAQLRDAFVDVRATARHQQRWW